MLLVFFIETGISALKFDIAFLIEGSWAPVSKLASCSHKIEGYRLIALEVGNVVAALGCPVDRIFPQKLDSKLWIRRRVKVLFQQPSAVGHREPDLMILDHSVAGIDNRASKMSQLRHFGLFVQDSDLRPDSGTNFNERALGGRIPRDTPARFSVRFDAVEKIRRKESNDAPDKSKSYFFCQSANGPELFARQQVAAQGGASV